MYTKTLEENKPKEDNSNKIRANVDDIVAAFKSALYQQIGQALLERHKLLFSFLLSLRILQAEGRFDSALYDQFAGTRTKLVASPVPQMPTKPNPVPAAITEAQWQSLTGLKIADDLSVHDCIIAAPDKWRALMTSEGDFDLPDPLPSQSPLLQLLIFKILRPDGILRRVELFVRTILGEDLLKNVAQTTLKDLVVQSGPKKPIVFILTPGNDPMLRLSNFAKEFNSTQLEVVSLGQGQGALAAKRVQEIRKAGGWLLLQNCHLYPSWMSELEDIVEETALIQSNDRSAISPEYRLWMSSAPSCSMPVSVLQRSVKYADEPRKGVKASLARIFSGIKGNKDELAEYSQHKKANDWKRLFLGLAFFHSILVERSRYGAIGWNGMCQFADADFAQTSRFLYGQLADSVKLPFDFLKRATVEYYYADKMLDVRDQACLVDLLGRFYNDNVIYSDYKFCAADPAYCIPQLTKIDDYITFVDKVDILLLKP